MTTQIRHTLQFEGEQWELVDATGEGFFHPAEHGLQVKGTVRSTACWRKYYCAFDIRDELLQLLEIEINAEYATAPLLHGRKPIRIERDFNRAIEWGLCGNLRYLDVHLPVGLTGGLIVCREAAKHHTSYLGPDLAWAFERTRELIFERGKLIETYDHSVTMVRLREDETTEEYEVLKAKINACFKLNYK